MAVERKIGQWSCQVSPDEPVVFQVSGHDIVVTNVSLGPELRGDARSTLVVHHINAQRQVDGELTQEAPAFMSFRKIEFASVHLAFNLGQKVALEVRGDNEVHLFGHYVGKPFTPSKPPLVLILTGRIVRHVTVQVFVAEECGSVQKLAALVQRRRYRPRGYKQTQHGAGAVGIAGLRQAKIEPGCAVRRLPAALRPYLPERKGVDVFAAELACADAGFRARRASVRARGRVDESEDVQELLNRV
ncbi:hypothetical protein B0H10DRAFT_2238503 [Mycena sp. CBHHK59/15]|nr:hypothetical protein B0H10DRAFT_2238503 [Mycena sp. CBHHK59/15]